MSAIIIHFGKNVFEYFRLARQYTMVKCLHESRYILAK